MDETKKTEQPQPEQPQQQKPANGERLTYIIFWTALCIAAVAGVLGHYFLQMPERVFEQYILIALVPVFIFVLIRLR